MDTVTSQKRSEIMSKVKSKGNKSTEQMFLSLLKERSVTGWRRQYKILGTPDFAFPKQKLAIFLDGAFWHGGPQSKLPKTNKEFWAKKIERNKQRDREVNRRLKKMNWSILRIWDADLKNSPDKCISRLKRVLAQCEKR